MEYLKDPRAIEEKSFDIIKKGIEKNLYSDEELEVVKRVVHATADFEFARLIKFSNGAVEAGIKAIKAGWSIVTDTRMARAGIKRELAKSFGVRVRCYSSSKEAEKMARERNITRAMAAIILSSYETENKIFVIGNAPTALFKLNELIREGKVYPALVVGVPVGFVGAKESKEELVELPVPSIVVQGCKGGTPVAVAIINALLSLAERRDEVE
ncbi:Cobalt-precorrin-8 methylmutase [Fervidicola ferrireducens]|uniref:Cobalt-precorrin-8 methylmutase n=1 Tax=Fervidicola ferrireducens TaxID=520764 RepID=A0A140LB19_9FIRM|nr:precorrin-8X methylmutase [Fervidicola ferrireducens]KXG77744.1 Cobalt-precorrin-8 methylmutase [Fervidicola ferrireducens]